MRTLHMLAVLVALPAASATGAGAAGRSRQESLQKTWSKALESANGRDTPVTRVVNLLKEMQTTLTKEMDEDKAMYKELMCWCNDNGFMKAGEMKEAQAKVSELTSTIEQLTAKSAELDNTIKETDKELAADKESLAEAKALREKQIQDMQKMELDSVQQIESLKAAITVLAKHQDQAFPQLESEVSLLSVRSKTRRWEPSRGSANLRSFDEFLLNDGFDHDVEAIAEQLPSAPAAHASAPASGGFLQQTAEMPATPGTDGWSQSDIFKVRMALKAGTAFMQSKHKDTYFPSYESKSGEIVGILKQMMEEMTGDLKDAQKEETERAADFQDLSKAKSSEIASGEQMSEQKEDEKAQTDIDLAEAKEDLQQTQDALDKAAKFSKSLKKTCGEATENFEKRREARQEEIKAVAETIEILTEDEARDAMTGTFDFLQVSSRRASSAARAKATALLRRAAAKAGSSSMALLATSVELNAFAKVKKAIDDMIMELKAQQADEVKKNDWCKAEFQENEMTTMKTEDLKEDLIATIAELENKAKTLEKEIKEAKASIGSMQQNLQKATLDRKKENLEFQTTIADQQMTIEVLHKALDKLATFYDSFLQQSQTPPVPQAEYKPNAGAGGVMSMIEKLIEDAKEIQADAKKTEQDAQAGYEECIADTNDSIAGLQQEVVTKSKAKGKTLKQHRNKESDLAATLKELEGLAKYEADLHQECDYVLKNFDVRQKARQEEMDALNQAKQILSGADLS